jgi:hypothetical protein
MAKQIIQFEKVQVNGVDLTDHISQVVAAEKWDDNDVSSLGALAHEHLLGLADPTIQLDFFQDFDVASVHATLGPLAGSNTPFPIVITTDSRVSVSSSNPKFTMQALMPNYDILNGQIGKPSTTSVTFVNAGQQGIVESDT